jgi:DNA repair exonuclease SbcCD ATPase subunit
MIKTLTLKNFGKWEELTVNFTSGLNVIRAANEQGKSTLYKAIGFTLWGARALPLSLDETVTWGKPTSSLRVTLDFDVSGVAYKISRSKSGAELTGPGVVVSGQEAVTNYVENLTKASQSVGMATLLASQSKLADSLDKSAIALIEKLSNMGLIDELVSKVQEKLPCGSTKAIEVALAEGETLAPEADYSTEHAAISAAQTRVAQAQFQLSQVSSQQIDRQPLVLAAKTRLQKQKEADAVVVSLKARYEASKRVTEPTAPAIVNFEELELAHKAQQESTKINAAYAVIKGAPQTLGVSRDEFSAIASETADGVSAYTKSITDLKTKLAVAESSIITGSVCGLCGEAYENIPAVVSTNSEIAKNIKCIQEQLASENEILNVLRKTATEQGSVKAEDLAIEKISLKLQGFVEVDESLIPRQLTWIGPEPTEKVDTTNYPALLAKHRKEQNDYVAAKARFEQACSEQAALQVELYQSDVPHSQPGDSELLVEWANLENQKQAYSGEVLSAKSYLAIAEEKLKGAIALHNAKVSAHEEQVKAQEFKRNLLTEMGKNNAVIKKLRDVRPIVARELWNLVLQGVSHIFSQVRGTPSTVTRTDDKFLVDGKTAEAYSGSTKDALGLAIRFMLQKTFLSNVDFVLLDEPASGADEVRETAMLATMTRVDFAQTILVTHSDLADTFAANVITL